MAFDLTGLGSVFDFAKGVLDRVVEDPAQKQAYMLKLMDLQSNKELAQLAADTDLAKAQIGVNTAEATNGNMFVSGWRPAVGWVSVAGLAYSFVVRPIAGPILQKEWGVSMEALDMGTLGTLLFGMLGLGSMRTVEKINGVASK